MLRFIANPLLRLFQIDGPLIPFINTDPGTNTPTAVPEPPVEPTTPSPPVGGLPAAVSRPGAGRRANDCAYLDDIWHRCVTETGQPSNQTCHATVLRYRDLCICSHPVADHLAHSEACRLCTCSYVEAA